MLLHPCDLSYNWRFVPLSPLCLFSPTPSPTSLLASTCVLSGSMSLLSFCFVCLFVLWGVLLWDLLFTVSCAAPWLILPWNSEVLVVGVLEQLLGTKAHWDAKIRGRSPVGGRGIRDTSHSIQKRASCDYHLPECVGALRPGKVPSWRLPHTGLHRAQARHLLIRRHHGLSSHAHNAKTLARREGKKPLSPTFSSGSWITATLVFVW